jgi:hypothetical protein
MAGGVDGLNTVILMATPSPSSRQALPPEAQMLNDRIVSTILREDGTFDQGARRASKALPNPTLHFRP